MTQHTLTNSQSDAIKSVIRENLQVIHDFCEQHKLTYYLSDGTLLGAIRHKGMIPWDDDADICMPREDYNRLLSLAEALPKPYKLDHFNLNDKYIYPFIKLINTNTEIIEYYGDKNYKSGVWVDIFPLDGTYKNIYLRKTHYYLTKKCKLLFELRLRGYQAPTNKESALKYIFKKSVKPLVFLLLNFFTKKFIFKVMDKLASHVEYKKSSMVGNLYTFIGIRASHKKEWFYERFLTEFDGYNFYVPKGYDRYLTNLYGDYMKPPAEKDQQTHNIEIITFDKSSKTPLNIDDKL